MDGSFPRPPTGSVLPPECPQFPTSMWDHAGRQERYSTISVGQIRTCLLATTFSPVNWPWEPQCTALQTDRWTDDM